MGQESRTYLFTWVDYVLLVATVVLSLGIGLYQALSGSRQNTTDEYLLGGRKMGIFPVAVSLILSYLSAVSLLGFPAEMYYYGITLYAMVAGGVCGTLLGAFCYVPVFYPLRLTSVNEYLDQRFESRVVVLIAWFSQMISQAIYMGVVLFAPALMLEIMAGFPIWVSLLLMGFAGTFYTTLGGLKAVIWTDFFQAMVIMAGLLTIVIKGTILTGGLVDVWYHYRDAGKAIVDFSPSIFHRQTVWAMFVSSAVVHSVMFTASQIGVQRYSAVSSLQAAKRAVLWSGVVYVVMQTLGCFSGIVAFSYFAKQGCEPLTAGYISGSNQIMPYFVMEVLSYPGVPGMFCACILCGSLSNLSSSLSAATALTWSDMLSHKLSYLSEKQKTMVAKIMAAAFGLISTSFGFAISYFRGTIIQITALVTSGISAPAITLFVIGPLIPRLNWKSATAGAFASMLLSTYLGLGSILNAAHQRVPPGDISHCPRYEELVNISSSSMDNMTYHYEISDDEEELSFSLMNTQNEASTESNFQAEEGLPVGLTGWGKIFQISHYWFGPFSILLGTIVSILASLIPGCYTVNNRKPHLYFPCIRAAMTKTHGKEYQAVDVKGCDVNQAVDVKGCDVDSNINSTAV